MKANEAYNALESILNKDKIGLDQNIIKEFEEKGFVTVLSSSKYHSKKFDLSYLESHKNNITNYSEELNQYKDKKKNLSGKLDSKAYRFFAGKRKVGKKQNELTKTKNKIKRLEEDLSYSKDKKEKLEDLNKELGHYFMIQGEYVAPTDLGKRKSKQLFARLSILDGVELNDALSEISQVEDSINSRYERFKEFYNALVEKDFSKNSETVKFAIDLSGEEGDFEEVYKKVVKIDEGLEKTFKKKWGYGMDGGRLKTVSTIMNLEGDPKNSVKELSELFKIANDQGHSNSYATLFEQAQCLEMPIKGSKAKWERFDTLGDALNERQWTKGSSATCYVAANLARRAGDVVEIAENFRNLEKKIIEKGRSDCIESGITSLILLDSKEDDETKTDKFNQAFEKIVEYGWSNYSSYYPAAAVISLMPGTVEENVQWLDDVTEMFKKDGISNDITNMALPIIEGGNRQGFTKDMAPSYRSSSRRSYSSSYSSYSGGSGFGLGLGLGLFG
jgi:hypothetical protein